MPVLVKCQTCGIEFRTSPSDILRGRKFCSRKCSGLNKRDRIDKICEYCGAEFEVTRYNADLGKGQFCSTTCRYVNGYSDEHKKNISNAHKGSKNYNWKGGITPERTAYWRSDEYQNWRNSVFERDDYTCQRCLERGGYLHSHHIIPYFIAQEERFEVDNGAALCKSCHNYIHSLELVTVHNFNSA